jgi:hypothetical protein
MKTLKESYQARILLADGRKRSVIRRIRSYSANLKGVVNESGYGFKAYIRCREANDYVFYTQSSPQNVLAADSLWVATRTNTHPGPFPTHGHPTTVTPIAKISNEEILPELGRKSCLESLSSSPVGKRIYTTSRRHILPCKDCTPSSSGIFPRVPHSRKPDKV